MMNLKESNIVKKIALHIAGLEEIMEINEEVVNGILNTEYERTYTPTEIGKKLNNKIGARQVNKLLEEHGYQYRDVRKNWSPTDKAEKLVVLSGGVAFKREDIFVIELNIRWKFEVIEILNQILEKDKQGEKI